MNRTIQAKAIIAGVLLLLPAVFGHADSPLTVRHLASEQNIITLNVQKRFLLLPIQDNAPEGRVTIVIGNRQAGTKWMDWGKDHYATVTFSNAPEGRCIALGWMSNCMTCSEASSSWTGATAAKRVSVRTFQQ